MKKSTIIILAVGVVLGIVAYKLLWTAIQPKIEHRLSEVGLTPNQVAAQGPLPGEVSLYEKELRACQTLSTPRLLPVAERRGNRRRPAQRPLCASNLHRATTPNATPSLTPLILFAAS